jgi:DNA-binding transcriptional LysR family regulator
LRIVNDLRLIRLAIALGRHGNFARAAEEMNISQPSLTRGIAALERSIGVLLFDRTPKGAIPTAFGRVLLERGESMLRSDADLRREIQLLAGLETGSLAIGAGPFAGEISVAKAVARVVSAHPRLQIKFTVAEPEQVAQDVLDGHVDVGVASIVGLEGDIRLVAESLPPLRVYLACRPGHPLTKAARPTLAQALQYPLATTSLRGAQALLASSAGAATLRNGPGVKNFIPQILVNSLAHARLIAHDSDALVTGTAALLAEDIAAGRLVKLDCRVPEMRTTYGVLHLRGRTLAPAAKLFIETLRAVELESALADVTLPVAATAATKKPRRRAGARR